MNPFRTFGLILLVAGVALLVYGLTATDSVSDSVSHAFTGEYTDQTMWYIIGGGVCAAAGLGLTFVWGGRPRTA